MAKRRLSKSDLRALNERVAGLGLEFSKKEEVDLVEEGEEQTYLVNATPWLFEHEGELLPHLRLLLERPTLLKQVTVDMGAVRFVTNGADVMRPGVTAVEEGIAQGQLVAVVDEQHGKPLAVGRALLSGEEMLAAAEGKVVATLHWVGDKQW